MLYTVLNTLLDYVSLNRTYSLLSQSISEAASIISYKNDVWFTGIGKSYLVSKLLAETFTSVGIRAFSPSVEELCHGSIGSIQRNDVLILISNSGKTHELVRLMNIFDNYNNNISHLYTMIISSGNMTSLTKRCDLILQYPEMEEIDTLNCIPSISCIFQLIIGYSILTEACKFRNITYNDYCLQHPAGSLGEKLRELSKDNKMMNLFS